MISDHDIEEILDLTHDGTLVEETANNISAMVGATIESWISAALDEWFWQLWNSPASLTQPYSFGNSIPSAAQGLHAPPALIPPSNVPLASVQPNHHIVPSIQVPSLCGPASGIAQSVHGLPRALPSGSVQPPTSGLAANLNVYPPHIHDHMYKVRLPVFLRINWTCFDNKLQHLKLH